MRIIGGALKRRKLFFPKTRQTRPLTDRAKETIFNVLEHSFQNFAGKSEGASRSDARLRDACVLDLFAGSGSFGIEALSRGASKVYFVDHSRVAIECIKKNLWVLELASRGHILKLPVSEAIRRLEKELKSFDLIFVDPPHNKGLTKKTLRQLDGSATLRSSGILIVGHSNREGLPDDLKAIHVQRSIKIGQAFVSFLASAASRLK